VDQNCSCRSFAECSSHSLYSARCGDDKYVVNDADAAFKFHKYHHLHAHMGSSRYGYLHTGFFLFATG
jgi:hypothetical protein